MAWVSSQTHSSPCSASIISVLSRVSWESASLKDQASFLEEQKALHATCKAEMEALIEGQNTALPQVVVQTAAVLRAQGPGVEARSTAADVPENFTAPHAQRVAHLDMLQWDVLL